MTEMGSDGITSAEGRLLAVQMSALRDDVREVKQTMSGMAKSLEQLVRIEEQQKDIRSALSRAFDEIKSERDKREKSEARLSVVEQRMPALQAISKWSLSCLIGTLGTVGGAVIWYVVQNHLK